MDCRTYIAKQLCLKTILQLSIFIYIETYNHWKLGLFWRGHLDQIWGEKNNESFQYILLIDDKSLFNSFNIEFKKQKQKLDLFWLYGKIMVNHYEI